MYALLQKYFLYSENLRKFSLFDWSVASSYFSDYTDLMATTLLLVFYLIVLVNK